MIKFSSIKIELLGQRAWNVLKFTDVLTRRQRSILESFRASKRIKEIAVEYDLSQSRVRQILVQTYEVIIGVRDNTRKLLEEKRRDKQRAEWEAKAPERERKRALAKEARLRRKLKKTLLPLDRIPKITQFERRPLVIPFSGELYLPEESE